MTFEMQVDTKERTKRLGLAELVEPQSFRDVMKSFCDLHRIGVKVFDIGGKKLVDVRVGNGPFCGYLFEHAGSRQACTQLVEGLKRHPFETQDGQEMPRVVQCFTGLRYVVLPITYDGENMGRLIFGPYASPEQEQPDEHLYQIETRLDRAQAEPLFRRVQQVNDPLIGKVLGQMQKVIEVLLYNGHRAWLTSQMHIESVTASYQELQEKNERLKDANERLRDLDQMKSNFVASVSHELRTPLTSVIGYSEMLLEGMAGPLGDEQQEYVRTIMEKGETLLALISQILDLSSVESGKLQLNFQLFDVADMVRRALTSVHPQARKKSIGLETQLASNLGAYRGDPDKLGQVLVNLLGNAVKFTPVSGRVCVQVDGWNGHHGGAVRDDASLDARLLFQPAEARYLRFRVRDTGIGIPAEKQNLIFDRFYQVQNPSTRNHGGTGLGLSIVKNFVEGHGGEVFCESEEGKGSCFTVLLPLDV